MNGLANSSVFSSNVINTINSSLSSGQITTPKQIRDLIDGLDDVDNVTKSALKTVLSSFTKANDTLSVTESTQVGKILDNFVRYASHSDCNATGNVTESLRAKAKEYLDLMSQGMAKSVGLDEPMLVTKTKNFNMMVGKVTECTISDYVLDMQEEGTP